MRLEFRLVSEMSMSWGGEGEAMDWERVVS